jgi:superfamily II DNA or RNA helicase
MEITVRIGAASNGTPVFTCASQHQALGRVFGAVYDDKRCLWMMPAFWPASELTLNDLEVLSKSLPIVLSDSAKRHVADLDNHKKSLAERALPAGFDFVTKPYDHQILGLCHAWWCLRSALFYEAGLGKSKIATDLIRLMKHQGSQKSTLVLGPLVTITNWGREIDRHSGGQLTWRALRGDPVERAAILDEIKETRPDVVLATYDTARIDTDAMIETLDYDTIVADESHNLKAADSQRSIAARELAIKASRRVIMTGTSSSGDPRDIFGQFKFLGECFMPENAWQFKRKFLVTPGPNSHVVLGFKNLNILNKRVTALSINKTKEECLDLPEQTIVDVSYQLSRRQRVIHNQLVEDMTINPVMMELLMFGDARTLPPAAQLPHRAAVLTKALQVASGFLITKAQVEGEEDTVTRLEENPKLDAAMEKLHEVLDGTKNKIIIWCWFKIEMDLIQERLAEEGWDYVRVDGDNSSQAQELIDEFGADDGKRVYLSQVSTGVGVTINMATYMMYYSMPFSLIQYSQSLDRNHRIGQQHKTTVFRMLGDGTPEPTIARLLDAKESVDTALTKRMDCMACPHSARCIPAGVMPFDTACIYKRAIARPVTVANPIDLSYDPDHENSNDLRPRGYQDPHCGASETQGDQGGALVDEAQGLSDGDRGGRRS